MSIIEKPKRICRVCSSTENEFKKHSGNTKVGICKPCHRLYCKRRKAELKSMKLNNGVSL